MEYDVLSVKHEEVEAMKQLQVYALKAEQMKLSNVLD